MAFKQVRDLLEWIVRYHEQLNDQYQSLSEEMKDERMRMALSFLALREQRLKVEVERYLEDAPPGVLDTWLIDSQQFDHPDKLARIPVCHGCSSIDDILNNVQQAHEVLTELYCQRAELATFEEEKELFAALASVQESEARLQSRDFGRLAQS